MINIYFIFVMVVIAMLVLRYVVHYFYPSWGTVFSNLIAALGLAWVNVFPFLLSLIDGAQSLPWANILDAATAQTVAFGILAANMIMRKLGAKAAV